MATVNPKACLKVLPAVVFVIWCINFIGLGAYAMFQDESLKNQPCGQETHLWKYCMLNTVFCFFTCSSYFLFPGGGEGARARAMVVTIFHMAFGVWGVLMWFAISKQCSSVLSSQYQAMTAFHHISVVHNLVFFTLYFTHEAYIGKTVGADLTLMSEIHQQSAQYAYGGAAGALSTASPDGIPAASMAVTGHNTQPPPDMAPLNKDIANDYENIIKTPPGHLPQGQP
jgi:hypothetical protein